MLEVKEFENLMVVLENGVKVLNLCPHPITYRGEKSDIVFNTVGKENALRLPVESSEEEIGGIVFGKTKTLPIELPEEVDDVLYIVPTLIRTTYNGRKDFISPTTDPKGLIKNEKGFTEAVTKFDVNW